MYRYCTKSETFTPGVEIPRWRTFIFKSFTPGWANLQDRVKGNDEYSCSAVNSKEGVPVLDRGKGKESDRATKVIGVEQ